jgi:uncharacterized damage-inducible protein DinB
VTATNREANAKRDHELAGIIDDLERGFNGDAWHGPPLCKGLDGVMAEMASARPIPVGHSIWEIVAHLSAWDDVIGRRISESRAIEAPDSGDFPPVAEKGAAAWSDALSELHHQHARLIEIVTGSDEAGLRERVVGNDYSVAHMLPGVMQHMAYHAGQIAPIRKLIGRG